MTKYEIDYLDSFFDKIQRGTKIASLSSKNKKSVSYRIPHSKNDQAIVHFKRQVEQTARKIYSVVSIKGNKGLTFETIENILGVDEPLITAAALKLLEKLGKIKTIGNNVIFSETRAKIRGQIFNIEVEKVAIGKAIVLVNGKWRANLYHYEYGGPRDLIRKGREFKVIGELYDENDNLNLRVEQVL